MKQIFVSSTFKDMHIERDLIQTKLSPDLNEIAYDKRVEGIQFQDLRWGIDANLEDEIENDKKIIEVCLDEIQNNRPYFCVLLGDRYGWIPENDLVKKTGVQYGIYEADEEVDKSITHLEIDYGFLKNPAYRETSFAYFRTIHGDVSGTIYESGPEEMQKTEELKAEIRRILPAENIREYDVFYENGRLLGTEKFVDMAKEDLTRAILDSQVSSDDLTENEKEIIFHKTQRDEKSIISNAREHLANMVIQDIETNNIVTLKGASGNGKSTLMAKISENIEKEHQSIILFSSLTPKTTSASGIIKIITEYLQEQIPYDGNILGSGKAGFAPEGRWENIESLDGENTGLMSKEESLYEHTLREYFAKVDKSIIILIDAIDQLDDPKNIEALLRPINFEKESKIKFIISFLEEESSKDNFIFLNDYPNYELYELSPADRLHVINSSLKVNNKELASELKEKIVKKSGSKSPLYVSLLVQRLLMMNKEDYQNIIKAGDDYQSIINYQKDLVASMPDDLEELIVDLLYQAAINVDTDNVDVYETLNYLGVSRRGLRESDLKNIFELRGKSYNALNFATLKKYLRAFFLEDKYLRIDFTHKIIRAAVLETIDLEDRARLHNDIANAFMSLPIEDPVKLGEQYYSAYKSRNIESAYELLVGLGQNSTPLNIDDINATVMGISKIHNTRFKEVDGQWMNDLFHGLDTADVDVKKNLLAYFVYGSYEDRTMDALRASKSNSENMLDFLARLSIKHLDDYELTRIYADQLSYMGVRFASGNHTEWKRAEQHLLYSVKLNEQIYQANPNDSNEEQLGNVYAHLAKFYLDRGKNYNFKASHYYQKSLDIFKEIADKNPSLVNLENLAMAYNNIANLYVVFNEGELAIARRYYKKTINIITRLLDDHDNISLYKTLAMVQGNIAFLDFNEGKFDSAQKWHLRAIATRKEIESLEPSLENKESLALAYNNVGDFFASKLINDKTKAETYYKKAIDAYHSILRHKAIVSAKQALSVSYDNLANLYADWSVDEAIENYKAAIDIKDELTNSKSSKEEIIDLATSYNNLAFAYVENKKAYDLGKEYYLRSLDLLEEIEVEGLDSRYSKSLACVHTNLGTLYYIIDDIESSDIHYQLAIRIYEELIKKFHDDDSIEKLLALYNNQAIYKVGSKKHSLYKIEAYYIKAMDLMNQIQDPYKSLQKTAIIYGNLGNMYLLVDKNYQLAEDCLVKSAHISQQLIDSHKSMEDIQRLLIIYQNLAFLYKEWGKGAKLDQYKNLEKKLASEINFEINDEKLNKLFYTHQIIMDN